MDREAEAWEKASMKDIGEWDFYKQLALQRARGFPFWLALWVGGRHLNGDQIYHEIIQETKLGIKFVEMEKKFSEWEKARENDNGNGKTS